MRSWTAGCFVLIAALAAGCPEHKDSAGTSTAGRAVYEIGAASRDGTGRFYHGREIALAVGHQAAAWLERDERETTELPRRVVDNLELAEDAAVADVGAGTGYFTFRIARRVPRGVVYAVDVSPEMLAIIEGRRVRDDVANVVGVRGAETTPNLPADSIDLALIVDAYHEFSHPREMLRGLATALRPGGRLVLVEYRGEDPAVPIKPLHKMTEEQARRELEANGFELLENRGFLPQQHFLVFRER